MKLSAYFIIGLTILFSSACNTEETPPEIINQNLKIAIVPNFGGSEFVLNDEYLNEMDYRVAFSKLRFYLSNIKLLKADGSSVDLSEIELFDYEEGEMVKNYIVDTDTYTGIEYSWGVPQNLEGTEQDPVNYESSHPLSIDNGMFWAWTIGYRYAMVEGRYDIDATSTDALVNAFSWHPGKDVLFRTITEDLPFVIDGKGSPQISINLDLSKLFYNGTDFIDVNNPQQSSLAGGNSDTFGQTYINFFLGALSHTFN